MTLIFSNHRFQYEVERLFRNFINEPGITPSTDKADAQGDFCLTEKVEYPGGAELSVDLVREGKRFCMSRSIPGGMPEKEQERELCILLYKALREYTGRDLPWGILTGVRPVKVLSKLTDAQAPFPLRFHSLRIFSSGSFWSRNFFHWNQKRVQPLRSLRTALPSLPRAFS